METAEASTLIGPVPRVALADDSRARVSGAVSARTMVAVASGLWAAGFSLLAVLRHGAMITQRYDLGNMTQAIWNTAHGRILEVTEVGGEQVNRLGIHVDPLLAAFAPLWWVWPSPVMLLVLQTIALAAGAFPVFWLARKHLGSESLGVKFALVYLLYPSLQWNAINDFHAVAFAVPLLLLAVWYLDEQRMIPFALCAGVALLAKEQIGLVVAMLGIWHIARTRQFRRGLAIAAAGGTWTAFALGVVIPHFAGGPSPYAARYQTLGGGPGGMAQTLFTDPLALFGAATSGQDLAYLLFVMTPLLALCLLSPLMLAAAPQFAISMLSERVADTDIRYQNAIPVIPVVIAAAVFATSRFATRRNALVNAMLVASTAMMIFLGPTVYIPDLGDPYPRAVPAGHRAALRDAAALVPAGVSASTTQQLGGHLAERRYYYVFPTLRRAEWIAVDLYDPWLPTRRNFSGRKGFTSGVRDGFSQPRRLAAMVQELKGDPAWQLVFERSGVLVFKRTAPA